MEEAVISTTRAYNTQCSVGIVVIVVK